MRLKSGHEINGYRIEKLIAVGGMGAVYQALQMSVGRQVALKTLHQLDDHTKRLFSREARLLARMNHPHIVQVYDLFEDNQMLFLAMELVEGQTLASHCQHHGPLSSPMALNMLRQCALGLAAAHEQGVIHRDLKPSNIIFNEHGDLKITDFGIACDTQSMAIEQAKRVLGTPQFMSPEQCQGGAVDARSDIYSLGATFYRCLTNAFPFTEGDSTELMLAHIHKPLAPPRHINRRIDGRLNDLICHMMAKEPRGRPPHMEALLDLIAKFESHTFDDTKQWDQHTQELDLFTIVWVAEHKALSRQDVEQSIKACAPESKLIDELLRSQFLNAEQIAKIKNDFFLEQLKRSNLVSIKVIEKNSLCDEETLEKFCKLMRIDKGLDVRATMLERKIISHETAQRLEGFVQKKLSDNEALGAVAVQCGLLSDEDLAEALDVLKRRGGSIGSILRDEGYISHDDFRALLKSQQMMMVEKQFALNIFSGGLHFEGERHCPACGALVFIDDERCKACKHVLKKAPSSKARKESKKPKKEDGHLKIPETGPVYAVKHEDQHYKNLTYRTLVAMIKSQKLDKDSRVCGPETQLQYKPLYQVPGLSRWAGLCHACGNKVQPEDLSCDLCGASWDE